MYPRAFCEKRMCCDETASRAAAASERLSPRSGRATQKKAGIVATPATRAGRRIAHSS